MSSDSASGSGSGSNSSNSTTTTHSVATRPPPSSTDNLALLEYALRKKRALDVIRSEKATYTNIFDDVAILTEKYVNHGIKIPSATRNVILAELLKLYPSINVEPFPDVKTFIGTILDKQLGTSDNITNLTRLQTYNNQVAQNLKAIETQKTQLTKAKQPRLEPSGEIKCIGADIIVTYEKCDLMTLFENLHPTTEIPCLSIHNPYTNQRMYKIKKLSTTTIRKYIPTRNEPDSISFIMYVANKMYSGSFSETECTIVNNRVDLHTQIIETLKNFIDASELASKTISDINSCTRGRIPYKLSVPFSKTIFAHMIQLDHHIRSFGKFYFIEATHTISKHPQYVLNYLEEQSSKPLKISFELENRLESDKKSVTRLDVNVLGVNGIDHLVDVSTTINIIMQTYITKYSSLKTFYEERGCTVDELSLDVFVDNRSNFRSIELKKFSNDIFGTGYDGTRVDSLSYSKKCAPHKQPVLLYDALDTPTERSKADEALLEKVRADITSKGYDPEVYMVAINGDTERGVLVCPQYENQQVEEGNKRFSEKYIPKVQTYHIPTPKDNDPDSPWCCAEREKDQDKSSRKTFSLASSTINSKTKGVIKPKTLSKAPEFLQKLLSSDYIRMGVTSAGDRNYKKNSFFVALKAVGFAFDTDIIIKHRVCGSQQLFSLSDEALRAILEEDAYIDISMFWPMMEYIINANIIVIDSKQQFNVPHGHPVYIHRPTRYDRAVIIYNNLGGPNDPPFYKNYQICEVIVTRQATTHSTSDPLISNLLDARDRYLSSFDHRGNTLAINPHVDAAKQTVTIERQYIDAYGKCRAIRVGGVIMLVTPCAPLCGVKTISSLTPNEAEKIAVLVSNKTIKPYRHEEGSDTTAYTLKFNPFYNHIAVIPLTFDESSNLIVDKSVPSELEILRQQIDITNRLKRLAVANKLTDPKSFSVDSTYDYLDLSGTLGVCDSSLTTTTPATVKVNHESTAARLAYFTRAYLKSNTITIKGQEYTKPLLKRYQKTSDFVISADEMVFLNEQEFERWITNSTAASDPTFSMMNGAPVLLHPIISDSANSVDDAISQAAKVCMRWHDTHINHGSLDQYPDDLVPRIVDDKWETVSGTETEEILIVMQTEAQIFAVLKL